jgi:solute carrier family 45 protein 1/2/4
LIRRRSFDEYESEPGVDEAGPVAPAAGGTVLGIHNLAIVMPQFIVGLANYVFKFMLTTFSLGCSGHKCHFQDC